jgi:shikimate dehydrogenase
VKIVLIGYRGVGKSTVGIMLARQVGLTFLDTDTRIEERAGRPIPEIFAASGEAQFRAIEREVIASLPADGVVISTGGGAVTYPQNTENLRRNGTVILLTASVDTILGRIMGSDRPPLTGLPPRDEVETLLRTRRDAYFAAADFCVATDGVSADAICSRIRSLLNGGAITPAARRNAAAFIDSTGIAREDKEAFARRIAPETASSRTKFFGIVGNPATHSKSPPLFSRLFAHYGIDAFYTRFQWDDIREIVAQAKAIDAKGLSVTIPFKEQVMPHVDEVDPVAQAIGAVNTVVFCGGHSIGHNTDWLGIRGPLAHRTGARAAILGAGGAAAAAAYALRDLGVDVTILVRTPEKAAPLAVRFGCRVASLEQFGDINPDVVVNATPVGMHPDTRSPVPVTALRRGMTIFDLVYTPEETPLVQGARRAGCDVITGTEMFVLQAAAQFRLFTGIEAPRELVWSMLP